MAIYLTNGAFIAAQLIVREREGFTEWEQTKLDDVSRANHPTCGRTWNNWKFWNDAQDAEGIRDRQEII